MQDMELEDISQLLNTIDDLVATGEQHFAELSEALEVVELKVDLDELRERGFWDTQIHEVELGLQQKLPVERYAKECFNWRQMREIRLGLLHGIDTEVYDNPLYSARQMREIRLGLEYGLDVSVFAKLILSAGDMKKNRLKQLSKAYKKQPGSFGRSITDEDTGIELRISDDCMAAFIRIPGSCKKKPALKELVSFLERNEVEYGIIETNLQRIIEDDIRDKEIKIATGVPVKPGRSGWYELFFQNNLPESPKAMENGRVDYSNVIVAEMVDPGMPLAVYHRSEEGKNGKTVTGIEIEAGGGEELPALTGEGIARDEMNDTYVATERGYVSYDDESNTLNVRKIYIIKEDANCYNGNIEFDGTVYVQGSVNDLTVISATGDVVIDGFVGNATIRAGGNVVLKGGMNAGGHGSVDAGGKIMGKFFEAVSIRSYGSIEGNYFLNCSIETDDRVIARGTKSRIMGGQICAAVGVDSETIGNYGTNRMILNVGDYYWIDSRMKQQQEFLTKAQEEIVQLEEGKAKLRRMLGDDVVRGNSIYKKTRVAIRTKELECMQIEKEIKRLRKVRMRATKAYVSASEELHQGVSITINGNVKEIAANIHGIVLTKEKTKRRGLS